MLQLSSFSSFVLFGCLFPTLLPRTSVSENRANEHVGSLFALPSGFPVTVCVSRFPTLARNFRVEKIRNKTHGYGERSCRKFANTPLEAGGKLGPSCPTTNSS